jgi:hypothetical protein
MTRLTTIACAALALAGCEKAEKAQPVEAPPETEPERPPGPTEANKDVPPAEIPAGAVELTKVDITRVGNLGDRTITVLGVPMGASRQEAERIITDHPDFAVHPDRANPERFYVDSDASADSVFYFIWDPKGPPGLNRVTVFVHAADLLVGRTRDLLTLEALDPDSEVRREFLGEPTGERVSLDVPAIKLRHITYSYSELGIEVVDQQDRGAGTRKVVFALLAQP